LGIGHWSWPFATSIHRNLTHFRPSYPLVPTPQPASPTLPLPAPENTGYFRCKLIASTERPSSQNPPTFEIPIKRGGQRRRRLRESSGHSLSRLITPEQNVLHETAPCPSSSHADFLEVLDLPRKPCDPTERPTPWSGPSNDTPKATSANSGPQKIFAITANSIHADVIIVRASALRKAGRHHVTEMYIRPPLQKRQRKWAPPKAAPPLPPGLGPAVFPYAFPGILQCAICSCSGVPIKFKQA